MVSDDWLWYDLFANKHKYIQKHTRTRIAGATRLKNSTNSRPWKIKHMMPFVRSSSFDRQTTYYEKAELGNALLQLCNGIVPSLTTPYILLPVTTLYVCNSAILFHFMSVCCIYFVFLCNSHKLYLYLWVVFYIVFLYCISISFN